MELTKVNCYTWQKSFPLTGTLWEMVNLIGTLVTITAIISIT